MFTSTEQASKASSGLILLAHLKHPGSKPMIMTLLLTSVDVVMRAAPDLDALPHVAAMIDAFVDVSSQWMISKAAQNGHIHLLKRLISFTGKVHSYSPHSQFDKAMRKAARAGFLHMVQWLRVNYLSGGKIRGVMNAAVMNGDLGMVEWVHQHYPEDLCDPSPLVKAAGSGDIAMMQRFLESRWIEWSGAAGFSIPPVLQSQVADSTL